MHFVTTEPTTSQMRGAAITMENEMSKTTAMTRVLMSAASLGVAAMLMTGNAALAQGLSSGGLASPSFGLSGVTEPSFMGGTMSGAGGGSALAGGFGSTMAIPPTAAAPVPGPAAPSVPSISLPQAGGTGFPGSRPFGEQPGTGFPDSQRFGASLR
jgi:hypothetical protein